MPLLNNCFSLQKIILRKILRKICGQVIIYCRYYCFHDMNDPSILLIIFDSKWQGVSFKSFPRDFAKICLGASVYHLDDSYCSWNEADVRLSRKKVVKCDVSWYSIWVLQAILPCFENEYFSKNIRRGITSWRLAESGRRRFF